MKKSNFSITYYNHETNNSRAESEWVPPHLFLKGVLYGTEETKEIIAGKAGVNYPHNGSPGGECVVWKQNDPKPKRGGGMDDAVGKKCRQGVCDRLLSGWKISAGQY